MSSIAPSALRVAAPSCPLMTSRILSRSDSDTKRSILIVTGADAAAVGDLAVAVAGNVSAGDRAVSVVAAVTPNPAIRPIVAVARIRSLIFIHMSVLASRVDGTGAAARGLCGFGSLLDRSGEPLPGRGCRRHPLGRLDGGLQ